MPPTASISVAIATHQGERFLQEQLDSIANQTVWPLEVVITDDQSTDRTLEVAEAFARRSPFPVRIFRNERRLHYAENFLRAASLCKGDLIAFCDQDDIWMTHKLSTCLFWFENARVQLVCHSAQTISRKGTLGYYFPHFKRTRILREGQCDPLENLPGFCMVFRRTLLSRLPLANRPKRLIPHDHLVWFLAALTGTIVKLSDVLALYRQHENNVFGARDQSFSRKLQAATETPGYLNVAKAEESCSRYLRTSLKQISQTEVRLRGSVQRWADRLAWRSRLHTLRFGMYSGSMGVLSRVGIYLRILASGGYLPDRSRTCLGPMAGMKDLVMGVAGFRRSDAT